jgi:predicted acetyltransferase
MLLNLELIPAHPEDESVLANLLELYIYDFTEFIPIDLNNDGRFGYPDLPLFWSDPRRFPFLVKVDGKLAGFVLVQRGSQISGDNEVWDIAEFFVLRRFRRHGTGRQLAHQVWRQHPGRWEVRVRDNNLPARRFWHSGVEAFTSQPVQPSSIEIDGVTWHIFSFISPS